MKDYMKTLLNAIKEYIAESLRDVDLSGKQDSLVSGENIKTVNGESLLGSGDIEIQGEVQGENNELILLHIITLKEDTKFICQELDRSYNYVVVEFENLWCVEGSSTSASIGIAANSTGSYLYSLNSGNFVNSSSFPSKGVAILEKTKSFVLGSFSGINSAGNRGGCSVGLITINNLKDTDINTIQFSLSGYSTHTMNAGATIRIYGR